MYLVFSKTRPFNFRFYLTYQQAMQGEQTHLPNPKRQLVKLNDEGLDAEVQHKLNKLLHAAKQPKLSSKEYAELVKIYSVFLQGDRNAWQPSHDCCEEKESMQRLHLYLPKEISVYTDGSLSACFGGYAAIFLESGRPFASISGRGIFSTSLEAEWKAIDFALSTICGSGHRIRVYTDCLKIVQDLYGAVRPSTKIAETAYQHILDSCRENDISFHHIKGHDGFDGSEWNELADILAKHEKDEMKEGRT